MAGTAAVAAPTTIRRPEATRVTKNSGASGTPDPRRGAGASRALVVVWDGMRPDLVRPDLTPNLAGLAHEGVWFDASHAVFPTVTRVNAATLASGAFPATHGLPGNILYAPLVDPAAPISFGEENTFAALRRAYGVFRSATLADLVADRGGTAVVVSNGTRGSALMCHPNAGERGDLVLHPTLSTPTELRPLVARLGPLPEASIPDTARNRWFAHAIADYVLPELGPELLVFWHNDPDKTQHRFGFGHAKSLGAIRDADNHLGLILGGLDRLGLRRETAVVVVSDHGYVSVGRQVDLATELVRAGLKAGPDSTDVVVAPNGGAVLVYAQYGRPDAAARVAELLRGWNAAEVVFSGARGGPVLDGTFSLARVGVDGPLAPDVLVALSWDDGVNEHRHRGRSVENGRINRASHGGISSWELRNTLVMAGAGIRRGIRSAVPAGNVDVAPTLLRLLGLPIPPTMQGRVLGEALACESPTTETTAHDVASIDEGDVRTELCWSTVDGHHYLDFGRRVPARNLGSQTDPRQAC